MDPLSTLSVDFIGAPVWAWALFAIVVVLLLAFDLGVLHRKAREIPVGESLLLSAGYIAAALLFGAFVWWSRGAADGMDYLTGYLIEKSLSLDNVFVISLIFGSLAVPREYQHRVLFYGILGVLLLRAVVIGLGAGLVSEFGWILYFFAAFLIFTGVKMLWAAADHEPDIAGGRIVTFLRRHLPLTDRLHGSAFVVRDASRKVGRYGWVATPLLLALLLVEFVDLVFALDSVPAILAITTDPYIVYTSNIFAVLGLRALYFALGATIHRFRYLKYALALILVFIGGKIIVSHAIGKVDPAISLGVTVALLAGGILFSLWKTARTPPAVAAPAAGEG